MNESCVSRSSASNRTASIATSGRPPASSRSSLTSVSSVSGGRRAARPVAPRRSTSWRTVASAISEPPPRTSTDCTEPSESFTLSSYQSDAPGEVRLEHIRRVDSGPHLPQAVQLGIHRRHELGADPRILGEIDTTTGVGDEAVEVVEEGDETTRRGRDVERERPARRRERQRTGVAGTEPLEDGEKRRALRAAELLDRAPYRLVLRVGHDVLVLHESAAAVHAVPIAHAVKWVEEGPQRFHMAASFRGVMPEPRLVEHAHREPVHEAVRYPRRRGEARVRLVAARPR